MELTSITPPPAALKALAHPVRLRMLGLLRTEGPATSTSLATRLGLNTGATSYHLRQLAQHGFVVDDPERGNGRERWWRAAHRATRSDESTEAAAPEAFDAFLQAVAVVHTEQLQRAVEDRPLLPRKWHNASTFSDWGLRLTPARAQALLEVLEAAIEDLDEDAADDPESADFVIQLAAFPRPGTVSTEQEPR